MHQIEQEPRAVFKRNGWVVMWDGDRQQWRAVDHRKRVLTDPFEILSEILLSAQIRERDRG